MKEIISVSPLEGKKVAVVFSDGISGIFDVTPYTIKNSARLALSS